MRNSVFDTLRGDRFVVLAHQLREPTGTALDVEACEWKVCHSRESADYWFSKWSETYSFVNVRECGRVLTFSQPSGPGVTEPLPGDRFEAGGVG